MRYMGSKRRIAKHILPIILKNRLPNQWYVEPFVGGANVIERVTGNRIGYDINPYLIACLKALANGQKPPTSQTEKEYRDIKNNKEKHAPWLVGYTGFALSFGGRWFEGYRRVGVEKQNDCMASYRATMKQAPLLKGCIFIQKDILLTGYNSFPSNSIIYCDPPYEGTKKYKNKFNSHAFWELCRMWVKSGHRVFISERIAPQDFKCVWEKEQTCTLHNKNEGKKVTEKLFVYKG